jgi:hypothetical protein
MKYLKQACVYKVIFEMHVMACSAEKLYALDPEYHVYSCQCF